MYTRFYGLREKPFKMPPQAAFFFESAPHSAALNVLEFALKEGHGLVLVTGQSGCGKTLLIEYLLANTTLPISGAQLSNAGGSAEDLLELILMAYSVAVESSSAAIRLEALKTHAAQMVRDGTIPVLFFDEAQQLTPEQLEQVRKLSNLHENGCYLLQIILVGQPEIRAVLARPEFQSMAQRIVISHDLAPLRAAEVGPFIRHRLLAAGASNPDLFTEDAVALIAGHCAGVPRMINVLCEAALVNGYADGLPQITEACVEEVLQHWESPALSGLASSDGIETDSVPSNSKDPAQATGKKDAGGEKKESVISLNRLKRKQAPGSNKAERKEEPKAEQKDKASGTKKPDANPQEGLRRLKKNKGASGTSASMGVYENGGNGFLKKVRANRAMAAEEKPAAATEVSEQPVQGTGGGAVVAEKKRLGKGSLVLLVLGGCALAAQLGMIFYLF